MRKFEFDREKFKNLVHYIISSCPDPAKLGSVKLHKILWKSDTHFYLRKGHPITGARYVKRPFGPCAAVLDEIRKELKEDGAIDFWRDRKFAGDYAKDVYEARRHRSSDFLSSDERTTVDYWIRHICLEHTAESISEDTHGLAWEVAAMNEELPMFSALVERGRKPNAEELEWARKKAKERGFI